MRSARTGRARSGTARVRTITAGEFKARCLEIMDEVNALRSEVLITKYGKPIAKLVPADGEIPDSFGSMKGTVRHHDDIVAPDLESWDEE
jgi:prevent-host-death family protein